MTYYFDAADVRAAAAEDHPSIDDGGLSVTYGVTIHTPTYRRAFGGEPTAAAVTAHVLAGMRASDAARDFAGAIGRITATKATALELAKASDSTHFFLTVNAAVRWPSLEFFGLTSDEQVADYMGDSVVDPEAALEVFPTAIRVAA